MSHIAIKDLVPVVMVAKQVNLTIREATEILQAAGLRLFRRPTGWVKFDRGLLTPRRRQSPKYVDAAGARAILFEGYRRLGEKALARAEQKRATPPFGAR